MDGPFVQVGVYWEVQISSSVYTTGMMLFFSAYIAWSQSIAIPAVPVVSGKIDMTVLCAREVYLWINGEGDIGPGLSAVWFNHCKNDVLGLHQSNPTNAHAVHNLPASGQATPNGCWILQLTVWEWIVSHLVNNVPHPPPPPPPPPS